MALEEHERIVYNSSSSLEIAKVNLSQLLLRWGSEVTVLKKVQWLKNGASIASSTTL